MDRWWVFACLWRGGKGVDINMNKLILRSCDVGLKNYDVLFSLQFDILFLQQQEQQDEQQQNHLSQLQFLWMVNIGYPKLFRFTAQHLVT